MTGDELLLFGGLFLVVMTAVTVGGYVFLNRREVASAVSPAPAAIPSLADRETWAGALQWMGDRAPATGRDGDEVRKRLIAAGYRNPAAVSAFRGLRYLGMALGAVLALVGSIFTGGNGFVGAICAVGIAYMAPDRVLDRLVKRRERRLRSALPAALDLLVLSIEAGQTIDTAVQETSRGLRNTSPELSGELNLLSAELRTSTSRADSLRAFAERNGEVELKRLANLLIDTDRFGTSLAPALRNHARYMRTRMRQQAQEKARKVGVKLIFPVFFLIFPSVVLVTLGPAALMIMAQMKDLMK